MWKDKHKKIIYLFMDELKKNDGYILKGGTALMLCYNLPRFSEDIDLDATNEDIFDIVNNFCKEHGFSYRVAKDTETVKRAMIHYGGSKPLKIEVSYRRKDIDKELYTKINDITVYKLNELALMKIAAFMGRDKIRDLYDVCFICNNYYDELETATRFLVQTSLSQKGIEHFDYIIEQEKDELIDTGELAESFLEMYEKFGLLYTEDELHVINDLKNKNDYEIEI